MRARFNKKPKEEKETKKINKRTLTKILQNQQEDKEGKVSFLKDATRTPFDQLGHLNKYGISPFLSYEDVELMRTSQSLYSFYRDTARSKPLLQLLHHVAYAELKEAQTIMTDNPELLLQKGTVTIKHTGQTFKNKTALQIAIYLKDPEMVSAIQQNMHLEDILSQQKEQFPEGFEDYQIKQAKEIEEGHAILEALFKTIVESKVEKHLYPSMDNIDENAKSAIHHFRNYLKTHKTETGQNIADNLLCKAHQLFREFYSELRYKDFIISQQVLGGIQRDKLSLVHIQKIRIGWDNITACYNWGTPEDRELIFHLSVMYESTLSDLECRTAWEKHTFASMVSDPVKGLGYEHVISGNRFQRFLTNYELNKVNPEIQRIFDHINQAVADLIKNPARPEKNKKCLVM